MTLKKSVYVSIIICLVVLAQFFATATEEQIFRDKLKAHQTEMEVSYKEYREISLKRLEPRQAWDADLRYVLFQLAPIALLVRTQTL